MPCQIRKTTKSHPLEGAKNMWKRIPHLIQRHQTRRKGYSNIHKDKQTVQFKVKHKVKASATDKRRMTKTSRQTPK